jgi:hypothetical protein
MTLQVLWKLGAQNFPWFLCHQCMGGTLLSYGWPHSARGGCK